MTENSGQEERAKPTIKHVDDNEFKEYFDRLEGIEEGYEIKLYRRIRSGKKVISTYLRTYVDELPNEEMIGNQYGGGQFMLLHYLEGNNRLEKTIWIDEIFTKKLEEEKRVSGYAPNRESAPRIDPLEYFGRIVNDMLKPMISIFQTQTQQQPQSIATQADVAVKMMERMTESMASSLAKVQEKVIDRQLERFDTQPERPDSVSDKMAMIKDVLDMAKTFGEKLLSAKGAKESLYKKMVMESDEFQAIKEDPNMFDAIYTEMTNDPQIGREQADKLFSKLGFEIGKENS